MEIRRTRREDIPAVDALLAASYPVLLKPDYPASVMVTALPLISRAQPELVTSGSYFGLWDEGSLRAAGGWTFGQPGGGAAQAGIGHIRHVVCDHQCTRRGYATALLEAVFVDARAAGVERLECLSTRTAEPFYKAVGFEAVGAINIPLRPGIGFPAIRMGRGL